MAGVHKDAQDLADRVNAVGDGWSAVRAVGGSHGGRAFVVRHHGRYIARISGHASVLDLALKRAEAELRRKGCPLPRKSITKKEDRMAAPTADERAASDKLRPRLIEAVAGPGQYDFAKQAVELIEASPLEQFGGGVAKSTPIEIASSTLGRFLEGGSFKQTNIDRFTYVLENLNGAAPVEDKTSPTVLEGRTAQAEPEAPPSPDGADLESLRSRLANEEGLRELAEETVAEVERERDEARQLAEAREQARLSLVERVDELAGKAAGLEKRARAKAGGRRGPHREGRGPGDRARPDGGRSRGREEPGRRARRQAGRVDGGTRREPADHGAARQVRRHAPQLRCRRGRADRLGARAAGQADRHRAGGRERLMEDRKSLGRGPSSLELSMKGLERALVKARAIEPELEKVIEDLEVAIVKCAADGVTVRVEMGAEFTAALSAHARDGDGLPMPIWKRTPVEDELAARATDRIAVEAASVS